MFLKILAVMALVLLPLNLSLWHQSHVEPVRYRWDLSAYNSVTVYLRHGVCGMHILTMPVQSAVRGEFNTPIGYDATPNGASFLVSSVRQGPNRHTWFVFPFWMPAILLGLSGTVPVVQGPIRRWHRRRHGRCVFCGYDLRGTRSGRCPECGWRTGE